MQLTDIMQLWYKRIEMRIASIDDGYKSKHQPNFYILDVVLSISVNYFWQASFFGVTFIISDNSFKK